MEFETPKPDHPGDDEYWSAPSLEKFKKARPDHPGDDEYWSAPPMVKFEKGWLQKELDECQKLAAEIPQWLKDTAPPRYPVDY